MDINKLRLIGKSSYIVVSSENYASTDEFLDSVALELENGAEIIELREVCSDKKFLEHAKRIRELCSIYNAVFIISERIDIAQIVQADGIHLEQNSIPAHVAREYIGKNMIIGLTVNTESEIKDIEDIDYLLSTKNFKTIPKIPYFKAIKKFFKKF